MSKKAFQNPSQQSGAPEEAAILSPSAPIQSPTVEKLMQIEGVEGTGTGQDSLGNEVLIVYLRDAGVAKSLPSTIDGKRIQTEVTGPISAQ